MMFIPGTSSIMLNGVPAKLFVCIRGVRQGDPLSPLTYVPASELLQAAINKAMQDQLIEVPIPVTCPDFPIIKYANDTILVMPACEVQLEVVKSILETFATATGLKVNQHKSVMAPINVSQEKMQALTTLLRCTEGSFPITYLGLPEYTQTKDGWLHSLAKDN
jgi:hypothetical protein